jgi:hypothetical protein
MVEQSMSLTKWGAAFILVMMAAACLACSGDYRAVSGIVTDAAGPVAGATVRLRGGLESTTTDESGRFTLSFRGPALHRVVTAWKEGYYPAGADLTPSPPSLSGKGAGGLGLILKPHPTADDPTYQWLTSNPDPNVALGCGHCMATYDEWKLDAHALSATNPRFLSVYNGTDLAGQPSAGPGFRRDSPGDPGNCAMCHAPAAALAHGGAADMNRLTGVETEGTPCDLCHKIGDVTLDAATGLPHQSLPGVQAYRLYRPAAGTQIFFGTLDDIPRRVSYSALEKESRFCAPCHSGGWWGVSAYASYDEWLASPYAAEGVTCQACHMPSSGGTSILTSRCAPAKPDVTGPRLLRDLSELLCRARGCVECHRKPADDPARNPLPNFTLIPDRPAETIHTHKMTGIGDEAFMRSAVAMTVTATQGPDGVLVDVAITNVAAGHDIPTDSPMRNMILVVTARDAQGNALPYLGAQIVPAWGGTNSPSQSTNSQSTSYQSTDYAGLPGKGFAKILEDWDGTAPAPQWRNGVRILSDNRIPARATDVSRYAFGLSPAETSLIPPAPLLSPARGEKGEDPTPLPSQGRGAGGDRFVSARLIFRRAFKPWMDAKGWNEPDLILAETTVKAARTDEPVLSALPQPHPAPLFPPSQATTITGERLAATDLPAAEQCIACHGQGAAGQAVRESGDASPQAKDAAAGWQASGHAVATTAPLYRAWFKAADHDTQGAISPYCAGCHTPIGLLSGQIRSRWAWSGRELHPLDTRARAGVSCAVCHAIVEAGVGNAAYIIAPECASLTNHGSHSTQDAVCNPQSAIHNPQFCAPCHEATNPTTGVPVMTTYSEWQASRFNTGDPATTKTCQDCHFAEGRHGALRPEDLKAAARMEILLPPEATPGKELELRVQVSNIGAGHDLPTGAAELRQLWLAVTVTDATGREVFSSGRTNEYGDPVEGSVTYGVTWRDAAGRPTGRLWEAAGIVQDRRMPAGGAVTETYRFVLPADARGPLAARAALNYRAAAGYLTALMTIYLGAEVPPAPVIELAAAEARIPVVSAPK